MEYTIFRFGQLTHPIIPQILLKEQSMRQNSLQLELTTSLDHIKEAKILLYKARYGMNHLFISIINLTMMKVIIQLLNKR